MALKLAGYLFTGPFAIETTAVRSNQAPVVYAIIAKGGQPWAPSFRVVDVGFSEDSGLSFGDHPRLADWIATGGKQIGVYLFYAPRSEYSVAARERIASEVRNKYEPPNDLVDA
jgi:hypothetical protein